jgi:guanylate kinase
MYESVTITTCKRQDDEKESKKYVCVDEAEFQVSTSNLLYHRVKNGEHYGIHINQV